ncbi:hypothetical protein Tco_0360519 [Tanacetum coccineum]
MVVWIAGAGRTRGEDRSEPGDGGVYEWDTADYLKSRGRLQCIRKGAQGTTDRRPERDDEEGGGERESRGAGGIRGANELRGRGTSAEGSEEAKNQYKSCRRPGVALFDEERRWVVRC